VVACPRNCAQHCSLKPESLRDSLRAIPFLIPRPALNPKSEGDRDSESPDAAARRLPAYCGRIRRTCPARAASRLANCLQAGGPLSWPNSASANPGPTPTSHTNRRLSAPSEHSNENRMDSGQNRPGVKNCPAAGANRHVREMDAQSLPRLCIPASAPEAEAEAARPRNASCASNLTRRAATAVVLQKYCERRRPRRPNEPMSPMRRLAPFPPEPQTEAANPNQQQPQSRQRRRRAAGRRQSPAATGGPSSGTAGRAWPGDAIQPCSQFPSAEIQRSERVDSSIPSINTAPPGFGPTFRLCASVGGRGAIRRNHRGRGRGRGRKRKSITPRPRRRWRSSPHKLESSLATSRETLQTQAETVRTNVRQAAGAAREGIRADVARTVATIQNGASSLLSDLDRGAGSAHSTNTFQSCSRGEPKPASKEPRRPANIVRGIFSGQSDDRKLRKINNAVTARETFAHSARSESGPHAKPGRDIH
jgi:hypothetical protein